MTAVAAFTQVAFRIRNDDGDETTATWRQLQNVSDTKIFNENFRVRFLIDENNSAAWSSLTFNLYYQLNGAGGYIAVSATTPVKFSLSGNFADHANTTTQLTGGSGSFVTSNAGMAEAAGVVNSGTKNYYFDTEWCLQLDSTKIAEGGYVDLRIYNGTSAIAAYTQTPRMTGTNIRALTSKNVATPVPTVTKSVIAQIHALVDKDIATPVPTVTKSVLSEIVALVSRNIATPVPTVSKSVMVAISNLVSQNVAASVPTVTKSVVGQIHVLADKDVATPAPTVSKSAIAQTHVFTSKNVATPVPTIFQPTIAQIHALTSKAISTPVPTITKSVLGIASGAVDDLVSQNISTTPTVSNPILGIGTVEEIIPLIIPIPIIAKLFKRGYEVAKNKRDEEEWIIL